MALIAPLLYILDQPAGGRILLPVRELSLSPTPCYRSSTQNLIFTQSQLHTLPTQVFLKMAFSPLLLCTLLLAAMPLAAVGHTMVYTAELEPFAGSSTTSEVTGNAVVFTSHNGVTVGYTGSAKGLNGADSTCAEVDGK
jgi:hypothetical protein